MPAGSVLANAVVVFLATTKLDGATSSVAPIVLDVGDAPESSGPAVLGAARQFAAVGGIGMNRLSIPTPAIDALQLDRALTRAGEYVRQSS